MKPQRVIIFGGTGFVGQSVCERLQRIGVRVTVPTRSHEKGRDWRTCPISRCYLPRRQAAKHSPT